MQTTAAEREEFRASLRAFLAEHSAEQDVRRLLADPIGLDPAVWRQLAEQLGVTSMLVPATDGGQGLSYLELAVVLEETGRALLCAPVLSSCALATAAVTLAAPSPAGAALLRDL